MKKQPIFNLILAGMIGTTLVMGQSEGEKLFKQICFTCHTIGKGRLVGPDLANVQNRRPEEWIIRFVQTSQSVIKSGDQYANTLFNQYNKLIMPDNPYTADQIRAIISYIKENSPPEATGTVQVATSETKTPSAAVAPVPTPTPGDRPLSQATKADIDRGRSLFGGGSRLANQGPTCNSCHHVKNNTVIGGGALAKDLTTVFTRLNEAGVKAILSNPPFPAMKQAYQNRPLTKDEVFSLAAFLQYVDRVQVSQNDISYGGILFFSGVGGVLLLLIFFGGLWSHRKKQSVNQTIFERQLKTTNSKPEKNHELD
jgi:mono/diheme cytochrome c family protein